jgi:hypothetical protein
LYRKKLKSKFTILRLINISIHFLKSSVEIINDFYFSIQGGEYVSKLEILNASPSEAGLYLCFMASQSAPSTHGDSVGGYGSMGSSLTGGMGYGGGLNKFDVIPAYLTVIQSKCIFLHI